MSHNTRYTHTLDKQSRQADRSQLDRLRRTYSKQDLENENWIKQSEGYLDNVKALESLHRRGSQFRRMGEETGESEG